MNISKSAYPRGRTRLAAVLQAAGPFVSVETAASSLNIGSSEAARLLARWATQGWLKRVQRGLYIPVSPASLGAEQVLQDAWLLVPQLYDPGYIAGWSAAEYWGLTEQLFREICVITARTVRHRHQELQGVPFVVKCVAANKLFDLKPVWRGQTKVMVSSPARTVIDMLDDPAVGGGIRHVLDCMNTYLSREDANFQQLAELAKKAGNGAVFKRLGFLLEGRPEYQALVSECKENLTQGNAKLDPSIPCKRLVRKWRLWIPDSWKNKA